MLERVTTHGRRLFEGFFAPLARCASHPPSEEGPPATCGSASRVARRPAGRTALTLLIGGSVGLAAGTASCSLVLGIQDPIVDAGQDATTHPKSDASSDSGKADVAPGKDVRTEAAPAVDGGCPTTMVDTAHGYFVTPGGSDAPGCGPVATPCKTIQGGILSAHTAGKSLLYVAPGLYYEAISLEPDLTVQGGVELAGAKWNPICNAQVTSAVQIHPPPGVNATVVADSLGGTATLRAVTIESIDRSELAPGESVYGVIARGSSTNLVLDDVVIILAPGANGLDGDAGPPASGSGVGTCPGNDGANGGTGPHGPASDGGTVGEAGYHPGNGATGEVGLTGQAGVDGGVGQCQQGCALTCGSACPTQYGTVCAPSGKSGCGGPGGGGGTPGSGGGSSIAVFAWGATVQITNSRLEPGSGGAGGSGGPGGPGGGGAVGAPGGQGVCITDCPGNTTCNAAASNTLDGGSAGGKGGMGGRGGTGGGGAGGWACGYLRGGDASVTVTATTFVLPEAGVGGSPAGAAGLSKPGCP